MNRDTIIFLIYFFTFEAAILIPFSIYLVNGIDATKDLTEEEMQQMRDSF
jgi:hypothetical protein